MKPSVYYNENDPNAAAWLRNLIAAGALPAGDVDERSIHAVHPSDLDPYTHVHLFAGIGEWAHALVLAGWPADRPVWTGSCPCQPFSGAGAMRGTADDRHLWPEFRRLIAERNPPTIFGEQVAGGLGRTWLGSVRADLEALGYAVGGADLCAASVGAPHIRQRIFLVADAGCKRFFSDGSGATDGATGALQGDPRQQRFRSDARASGTAAPLGLGDADSPGLARRARQPGDDREKRPAAERASRGGAGPWADPAWVACSDGKIRPIPAEPRFQPLVDGLPAGRSRVVALRGAGNAIVPQVAAAFVSAAASAITASKG